MDTKESVCNVLEEFENGMIKLTQGGAFVCYLENVYITEMFNMYIVNDKNGRRIATFSTSYAKYIPFEKAVNKANE